MKNTMTKRNLDELFNEIYFERNLDLDVGDLWKYFEKCVVKAWGKNALETEIFKAWDKELMED